MKSMTAFASHSFNKEGINARMEIKSVNSKNLDIKIRMNESFNQLEYELSSYLRKKIHRGKVFCRIDLDFSPDYNFYTLKWNNLDFYARVCNDIKEKYEIDKEPSPVELLRLPDVLKFNIDDEIVQKISNIIFSEIDVLLKKYNTVKKEEAEELKIFFKNSVDTIKSTTEKIDMLFKDSKESIRSKLNERLQELNSQDYDKNRMEEEILYYIEKIDITEEIIRLNSHIKLFNNELDKDKNGKKIDFILQEMNRESNTIASKSQNNEIIGKTIILKDVISQMREQAANVE